MKKKSARHCRYWVKTYIFIYVGTRNTKQIFIFLKKKKNSQYQNSLFLNGFWGLGIVYNIANPFYWLSW